MKITLLDYLLFFRTKNIQTNQRLRRWPCGIAAITPSTTKTACAAHGYDKMLCALMLCALMLLNYYRDGNLDPWMNLNIE